MVKYTLGFVFNASMDRVLLIHKLRPEWQMGKVNGLGGKVEEGESGLVCMVREIQEEAGLETDITAWKSVGIMRGRSWSVEIFGYVYAGDSAEVKSMEDQCVEWFDVKNLPTNALSNVHWLVPLAVDKLKNGMFSAIVVDY